MGERGHEGLEGSHSHNLAAGDVLNFNFSKDAPIFSAFNMSCIRSASPSSIKSYHTYFNDPTVHSPASPFTATVSTLDLLSKLKVMSAWCERDLLMRTSILVVLLSVWWWETSFVDTICLARVLLWLCLFEHPKKACTAHSFDLWIDHKAFVARLA